MASAAKRCTTWIRSSEDSPACVDMADPLFSVTGLPEHPPAGTKERGQILTQYNLAQVVVLCQDLTPFSFVQPTVSTAVLRLAGGRQ